ncbi:MAG: tetratricopeptide repeat protein, partial [Chloroflexota bacterium]
ENQIRLFILRNLSLALGRIGQLDEALRDADEALAGFAEYGSVSGRASTLYLKGVLTTKMGRYRWAEQLFKTSLQLNKQATQMKRQWFLSTQLAMLYENWGRPLLALYYAREALNLTTEEKDRYTKRTVQTALGYALIGKGKAQEAKAAFLEALSYTDGIGTSKAVVELEAGIIEAELLGGDVEKAGQLALHLIPHLTPEVVPACLQPFRVYLTAYRALRGHEPHLAQGLLDQALELMEEWEKSIPDEKSRETFRTAVPAHRALLEYGGRVETGA